MIYSSCAPGWMPKDRVVLTTIVSICYMTYSFGFTYISLLTGQIYSEVLHDYHRSSSLRDVYHFTLGFLLSVLFLLVFHTAGNEAEVSSTITVPQGLYMKLLLLT